MNKLFRMALATALLVAFGAAAAGEVTSGLDDGSGGTLREVVAAANDPATVTVDPAVERITLGGVLNVTKSLTIQGNGTVTVSESALAQLVESISAMTPAELTAYLASPQFTNDLAAVYTSTLTRITASGDLGITPLLSVDPGKTLNLSNLHFFGITRNHNGTLNGGGVVGANSTSSSVSIGAISASVFAGNTVSVTDYLQGGGVVGAYSFDSSSSIAAISGSVFAGNTVRVTDYLDGGGVVGAYSRSSSASIGAISASVFAGNTVSAGDLYGGGVVGAYSTSSVSLDAISDSVFAGNTVSVTNYIQGGGVVGTNSGSSSSSLVAISDSVFAGNTVSVTDGLIGGGVVGVRSSSSSSLGAISDSVFAGNTVSAISLSGGGVVGALSNSSSSIGAIERTEFRNNSATSTNGNLYAGVLYSSGLATELVITDSVFADNAATASSGTVYAGAIGIDGYFSNSASNTVTLKATAGNVTLFRNNAVEDGNGSRANSLFFGGIQEGSNTTRNAMTLNVRPEAGGIVALVDPIAVTLNGGGSFTMNVDGDSAGYFTWGGDNRLYSATAGLGLAVNFDAGTTTELLAGYQLRGLDWTDTGSQSNVAVTLGNAANLVVNVGADAAVRANALFGENTVVDLENAGDKANLSAVFYEFVDASAGVTQQVLDNNDGVNADVISALFNLVPGSDLFTVEFGDDDKSVTIANAAVVSAMTSYGDNTTSSFFSGAMQEEWEAEKANLGYDADPDAAFRAAISLAKQSGDRADNYFGTFANAMFAAGNIFRGVIDVQNAWWDGDWENYQSSTGAASGRALASPRVPLRPSWRAWAGYVGSHTDQDSHGGHRGYDSTYHGVAAGLSRDFSDCVSAGLYYAYANGDTDQKGTSNEADTDAHHAGAFVSLRALDRRLAATFDVGFGWYDHDFSARGAGGQSVDQQMYTIGLETKYAFAVSPGVTLSPFASARWLHSRHDGIDEGLAAYNMDIDSDHADSFATRLGLEMSGRFDFGCVSFSPTAYAGWRHEWGDREASSRAKYSPGGIGFGVRSAKTDRDSLVAGAKLRLAVGERTEFHAGYDLTAGRRTTDHVWRVGVGVRF